MPPILPPQDGFLFLDREKFHASFAGDLSAEQAAFMADSQVPWGVDALGGTISEPAWRSKPSWYLVATEDRMIPPPAQREMSARAGSTVVEVAGSHSIYVSKPEAVADLIKKAASNLGSATLTIPQLRVAVRCYRTMGGNPSRCGQTRSRPHRLDLAGKPRAPQRARKRRQHSAYRSLVSQHLPRLGQVKHDPHARPESVTRGRWPPGCGGG